MVTKIPTLMDLEVRVSELTTERNRVVREAQQAIIDANTAYDDEAIPLMRQIKELRKIQREQLKSVKRPRLSSPIQPDPSWTAEDIAHYESLVTRNRKGS